MGTQFAGKGFALGEHLLAPRHVESPATLEFAMVRKRRCTLALHRSAGISTAMGNPISPRRLN